MNGFSALWQGIVDELNLNQGLLGIDAAERAETGKVTTLAPPSAAVWINLEIATFTSQSGALRYPADIIIYCVAAPHANQADAVDSALEIAKLIMLHLTNKEIAGAVITQPENEPVLEVIDNSSTQATVGVLLKGEIVL